MRALFHRLIWRVIGTPQQRAENWRAKQQDRVPLRAIWAHLGRERLPAEVRVKAARDLVSRELLDLQRARHTMAASNVLALRKKEA